MVNNSDRGARLPKLTLEEFIRRAALDPLFLKTYATDPLRLADRFKVDADVIEKISKAEQLLSEVAKVNPAELSRFRHVLLSVQSADFGDNFSDRGFKDNFRDGGDGGFKDRHRDDGSRG